MIKQRSRRDFLKALSGLGMAGILPPSVLAQMSGTSTAMHKRAIPGTGEMLPMVGLGSSAAVIDILNTGPGVITSLIEIMVNHGASVIDTAPRPEAVDEAFAAVLSDSRWKDKLFVTSKMGRGDNRNNRSISRDEAIAQVEQTRRLFKRHPADVIFIDSMLDMDVHWPTLREMKDNGDARYIGFTMSNTSGHEDMLNNMRRYPPDIIAVNYSMLEPYAEERILPLAQDMGVGVIIITPFGGGEYFQMVSGQALPDWAADFDCSSWAQFNLKYLLGNPAVTSIVTETTKTHHMEENLLTATGRIPDQVTRTRMKQHIASLRG